ncbi:MAG: Glu-tRNA(Gln) amidotransferase subunit GatE [Candidatus Micrarchaeia archaeon]
MKVGIEIHQRLNTGKLFCRCPSISKGITLGEIRRQLHAVKSEMGEKDIAAVKEELKNEWFTYVVTDNSCLVETDDEPPHEPDRDALLVAVAVAKHMHMSIVDEIFFMRKIVIDGSNTSGFQRTGMIGLGGYLKCKSGKIGIQSLFLEEESAGIIDEKGSAKFSLDRLGIPLIEIATAPDIKSGEQAREVAESIGMMLRMTGMAARGIGTIRQDLNISADGGTRCEIKGVQELDDIPLIVDKEVKRQERLLELIPKIPAEEKPSEIVYVDVTEQFKNGKGFIQKAISEGARAIGVLLPGMKGLLGYELYENRRYGTELADYARVFGFGGMIHGDEDFAKYGVDKEAVERELKVGLRSSYAILIGKFDEKMRMAFQSIIDRAYMKKIPAETRKALKNGESQYMRPMPTGARMYPETDVEPIIVDEHILKECEKYLPRDPDEVLSELEKQTNKELALNLLHSPRLGAYYKAIEKGADAKTAAVTFVNTMKALAREGLPVEKIDDDKIIEVLVRQARGEITKKAVEEVLRQMCRKPNVDVESIIEKGDLKRITGDALKKIVIEEKGDIQKILSKYRLRVEAEELAGLIGS